MKRDTFLPFHLPSISEAEIDDVAAVLRSGWLTTGPKTREFEQRFAEYVGARHAVALNSGTAALHLALDAAGVGEGDRVVTTPFTFAASAEVIFYLRAEPVFVDVRRDSGNIDPERLAETLETGRRDAGARVKVVLPVHFAGQPCAMEPIVDLAAQHGLRVVEDAAHALPARRQWSDGRWRPVGSIGDMTCFSFYATKTLTTGEGGMLTTDSAEWADRARMMSLHGISRDAWKRYTAEGSWYYEVLAPGFKYNLTDVAAALGVGQLRRCTEMYERRRRHVRTYGEALADVEAITLPSEEPGVEHAWHLYVIRLRDEMLTLDRARFVEELRARSIGSSVHFIPLHLHPYYRERFGFRPGAFPNAEWIYRRCVSLPLFPDMTDEDVYSVAGAIRDIVKRHGR
ncbi:MAG: DegT/DnrJ/EryC1/StrS family aminotransferase [Candidatus Rokuibacteriota bacterium]